MAVDSPVHGYSCRRHRQGSPRSQTPLLSTSLEDSVPEDRPVRVIGACEDSQGVIEMRAARHVPWQYPQGLVKNAGGAYVEGMWFVTDGQSRTVSHGVLP